MIRKLEEQWTLEAPNQSIEREKKKAEFFREVKEMLYSKLFDSSRATLDAFFNDFEKKVIKLAEKRGIDVEDIRDNIRYIILKYLSDVLDIVSKGA